MTAALLPPNKTPLESAVAAAIPERPDIAERVGDQADMATIDARLLPHKAWDRSVDYWDPAWSPAVQRAVTKASPRVHAVKGRPAAITAALSAAGYEPTLLEWWERGPDAPRDVFEIELALTTSGAILDESGIRAAATIVRNTKRYTQRPAMTVRADIAQTTAAPLASQSDVTLTAAVEPRSRGIDAGAGVVAAATGQNTLDLAADTRVRPARVAIGGTLVFTTEVEGRPDQDESALPFATVYVEGKA